MKAADPERSYRYALIIMAKKVAQRAIENHVQDMWEDYPEIGEHDWGRIVAQARTEVATAGEFMEKRAYETLAARADDEQ